VSDAHDRLERTFYSVAHVRAAALIATWMVRAVLQRLGRGTQHGPPAQKEAGMRTWTDVVGNVHGRVEARSNHAYSVRTTGCS
jgi:hypothetical protein